MEIQQTKRATGLIWPDLISGILEKRYKRFMADVTLPDGSLVTAHCPNSGSMKACCEPGRPVYLSLSDNPKRKLKYTWELIKMPTSLVCVNTLVEEKTARFPDAVTERGLKHLTELKKLVAKGDRCVMFYLIQRMDAVRFRPADDIDPAYGKALRQVVKVGVEILAYDVKIDLKRIRIRKQIPIVL